MKIGSKVINIDKVMWVDFYDGMEHCSVVFGENEYFRATKEEGEKLAKILKLKSEPRWVIPFESHEITGSPLDIGLVVK